MHVKKSSTLPEDMNDHGPLQEEDHTDWAGAWNTREHRLSQIEGQSFSRIRQTTGHQRNLTEQVSRPSLHQPRLRSNTSTNGLHDGRPQLKIDTDGRDRRPASMSLHARNESSSRLAQNLKSKASRLLRRQGSHGNLTSLQTFEYPEEDQTTSQQPTSQQPSPPLSSPKKAPRKLQRSPNSQGKATSTSPR